MERENWIPYNGERQQQTLETSQINNEEIKSTPILIDENQALLTGKKKAAIENYEQNSYVQKYPERQKSRNTQWIKEQPQWNKLFTLYEKTFSLKWNGSSQCSLKTPKITRTW